jgi:uncharacterized membrane protein YidH (DUF202 family)
MTTVARMMIVAGLVLALVGFAVYAAGRWGGNSWRMPGDIVVQRKNFTFYFPVVTSIVVSVVLSLLFYLFRRFIKP